jgi:hypothetical protein
MTKFTRKEIQERFKKLFGREMTAIERRSWKLFGREMTAIGRRGFFRPPSDENDDAGLRELGGRPAADVNSQA